MAQTTLGGDFTDLWSAPQIYNEHSRHSFEIYICPFNFPPQGFNSYRALIPYTYPSYVSVCQSAHVRAYCTVDTMRLGVTR